MAGMEFEYDEEGSTFYYFLLSFWALIIIPATYYGWPRRLTEDEKERTRRECHCTPCDAKRQRVQAKTSWVKTRRRLVQFLLIFGWVIFFLLAYKVSMIQVDYTEYDPFQILQIDRGASDREIKKAYRKLSLQYHPDKETGDSKMFMKVAKAYAALTDEESRKNWEEHGNPDGPGVTRFGIGLPRWLVEKENSMWVLMVYIVLFMVIMPVVVGVWWYRSIKFSKDQVLLNTSRLYLYFFSKNPQMILKKVIMVLGASFEFDKSNNPEINERPSDNEEVPQLMKQLPNLDEKNKERPLCFGYSVKARALLHAHFARLQLPPNSLEEDRKYILKKCPALINEMINIISQLVASAMARQ
ncbi:translocation protein SEC63 homolog, partial [Mercenaria mercenaria]